jgi:flagellum-specific ATP synthase
MSLSAGLLERIQTAQLLVREGRVVQVRGSLIEAQGPVARLGEECVIDVGSERVQAEVIGFAADRTLLMPYTSAAGVLPYAKVRATGSVPTVAVGPALLGRVVNAWGAPVDGKGPIETAQQIQRPLACPPPVAMQRRRINAALETGLRVIDGALTLAKGQRVGLFAGSGVGKSVLLSMLARGTQAQTKVIALIGERAREVREFVEDQLGEEGLASAVVVVATASESAIARQRAAYAATTIAEHFRDMGQDVLLIMDSLTRFAMAMREIGLAAGEPPTARGYTPSVYGAIPLLCERAGTHAGPGSITAIYSVLVEGDDMNEPIADAIRSTLDGHIVLDRDIASGGRYPAVDLLRSVSRLRATVTPADVQGDVRALIKALSVYERNRQLIEIGAYKPGVQADLDRAVGLMPRITAFLSQHAKERSTGTNTRRDLRALAAALEGTHA